MLVLFALTLITIVFKLLARQNHFTPPIESRPIRRPSRQKK
ncbi:hypothetical protein [Corallococcus exiguus]|nr:hypothetical protein [Corallococcus exiguus]